MSRFNTTFEIHLHGTVPLREEVTFDQLQDALRPIWVYAGARSLTITASEHSMDGGEKPLRRRRSCSTWSKSTSDSLLQQGSFTLRSRCDNCLWSSMHMI
jgi:hypothetical protein